MSRNLISIADLSKKTQNKCCKEFFHALFFWSYLLYFPSYTGLEFLMYLFIVVLIIMADHRLPTIDAEGGFLLFMGIALFFSVISTLNYLLISSPNASEISLGHSIAGYAPKIIRSVLTYFLAGIYIKYFKFGRDFLLGMCVALFLGSMAIIIEVLYPDIQYITGQIFQYAQITSGSFTEPQRGHGLSNSSDVASMLSAYLGIFLVCIFRQVNKWQISLLLIIIIIINLIAAILSARVGFLLGAIFLILSIGVTKRNFIYALIFLIAAMIFGALLAVGPLEKTPIVYNFERSFNYSRILSEMLVLFNSGIANVGFEKLLIGNGEPAYIGQNRWVGDMQYGQLISGIGFLGTCAIIMAVIFPAISFIKKKSFISNLDGTAVFCTALLTLLSAFKGPYLLSRPLFDLFMIISIFFSSGGTIYFGVTAPADGHKGEGG